MKKIILIAIMIAAFINAKAQQFEQQFICGMTWHEGLGQYAPHDSTTIIGYNLNELWIWSPESFMGIEGNKKHFQIKLTIAELNVGLPFFYPKLTLYQYHHP